MSDYKLLGYNHLNCSQKADFIKSSVGMAINQHFLMNNASAAYYAEYLGRQFENRSQILYRNNSPILALPALCRDHELNFGGNPTKIVSSLQGFEYYKSVRALVNLLQKEAIKYGKIEGKISFDSVLFNEALNFVQTTTPVSHGYVNCQLSEENIKKTLRKSYKSLVNWGRKNLTIKVIDLKNPDAGIFFQFKDLHFKASSRKTRSDKSWDYQFEMVKKGHAYLVAAYYGDKLVSGCFIMCDHQTAFYGVAASDRQLMQQGLPLNHFTLWFSMMTAKNKGCKKFILGDVGVNESVDNKMKNIALFKRGFATDVQVDMVLDVVIS